MKQKYPKQNCHEIGMDYENRWKEWKKDAIGEYILNTRIEEHGDVALYTGPMQCFCKYEKAHGVRTATEYKITDEETKKVKF